MKELAPQISVIIPTYNRADLLEIAVQSVLSQQGATFEVIVVDDGSTDGTYERLQEWAKRHQAVRVLHQPNSGRSVARNLGLQHARGQWLMFLDSDDVLMPDALAALLARAAECPTAAVVAGGTLAIAADGSPMQKGSALPTGQGWAYPHLIRRFYFSMGSYIIKRSTVNAVGGFDRALEPCEDFDFCLRASLGTTAAWMGRPVLQIRTHVGNSSAAATRKSGIEVARRQISLLHERADLAPAKRRRLTATWYMNIADDWYSLGQRKEAFRAYLRSVATNPVNGLRWHLIRQSLASLIPR